MKLPYPLFLAMILALSVACRGGSPSRGNDDDSTNVTDDCYPGCQCHIKSAGDSDGDDWVCVESAPRTKVEFNWEGIRETTVYYEISTLNNTDSSLRFAFEWASCGLLFKTGYLNLPLELDGPLELEALLGAHSFDPRDRGDNCLETPRSEWKFMSSFGGCGKLRLREIQYDHASATVLSLAGSIGEAGFCHLGSFAGVPPLDEQHLGQEIFILGMHEFKADKLEATLDFHD